MRIRHTYNLRFYTPKPWETFLLRFVPYRVSSSRLKTVVYKRLWNRVYICQTVSVPAHLGGVN